MSSGGIASIQSPESVVAQVDDRIAQLQSELDALNTEVRTLRRRDETINYYMQRVDEEMRLAAKLQRDFLPKSMPEVGPVRFHTLFRPAGYVSGDLYDVIRLDERNVAFYVADAVGHGMPAALLTMFMKRALVTKQILTGRYRLMRPGETMHLLNQALLDQHLEQATFATALYGVINCETLAVSFARAGHPCPLLLKSDGTVEELQADGGLLGIFEDETYQDGRAQLTAGDRLILFTDGVEVAFAKGDTVDIDRWKSELLARRHLPTDQLLQDLSRHIDHECSSLDAKDDLTIIIAEIDK
ncbi:MAG TPA: PP2C family protein-serine/threonine phosphatase [Tepidisphaeraceae bacterium]|jgi:serine phosphatase RsbU (regulator of sigma subunit)|nr:PP2C family protein-serine/threonine phosphatase [Tepidisphaeraceae bacterium]